MTGADFFASKKSAAVFKHGILSRYPVVFAAKTGKSVDGNRVVFLDGYAGRGEYDDGQPGSPLLLSRCAEFVSRFRNVHGVFVEQDRDNFRNLQRVLDEKGGHAARTLLQGSLDDHLPEVLRPAKGAPLFAFLDPFGLTLDFDRLRMLLLGRPAWPPTEVLLHFSVLSVARMGRAVRQARECRGELPERDRKTADRLDRFLGGGWWQNHFAEVREVRDEGHATDAAMAVCEVYEKRLTAGTCYRAIRMPVRPRPDLLPKYVLLLFTASADGAWHFADALGKAGVEWSVAWQREEICKGEAGDQLSLFSGLSDELTPEAHIDIHHHSWVDIIATNIKWLLDQVGPFRPADFVPEVYGATLGQASIRQVRAAVKSLKAKNKVANTGIRDFWKERLHRPHGFGAS